MVNLAKKQVEESPPLDEDVPVSRKYEKKYSDYMRDAGKKGVVWNEKNMFAYLDDPSKFLQKVTGNSRARGKMPFKLKNAKQRADVIAYLKKAAK